jgi:hypothetical protein
MLLLYLVEWVGRGRSSILLREAVIEEVRNVDYGPWETKSIICIDE